MSSKITELPPTTIAPPSAVAGPGTMPPMPELTPARRAWVENITILLHHKKLILWTMFAVTAITAVYAFGFMPNYYKATAVVLPARKPGGGLDNAIAGVASSLKDLGLSKLSGQGGEESYTPVSLISSRELQEKLVRQFDFIRIYDVKNMEEALKAFNENLDCDLTPEGNFVVSFEDTSRTRAAQVTNAAIDAMNEINSRLAKEEARHNSKYITERYELNLAQLDSSERALGQFEKANGIYVLQEQARAELSAIAGMEQQKSMAEIELQNVLDMFGTQAPEATSLRHSISGLEQKLEQMRTGMDAKASSFVPTDVLPEAALQFLRLTREVEIQSKLKAFFLPLYEQARLDENRDLLSYVTLDHAVPPMKKSKPHRSVVLLAAMLGSLVAAMLGILFLDRMARAFRRFNRDAAVLRA